MTQDAFTALCRKVSTLPVSTAYATKDLQIRHQKGNGLDTFNAKVGNDYLSLYVVNNDWNTSVFIVRA